MPDILGQWVLRMEVALPRRCALPLRSHPEVEIMKAIWMTKSPLKWQFFGLMGSLKRCISNVCQVLVPVQLKEVGQVLPTGSQHVDTDTAGSVMLNSSLTIATYL